MGKQLESVSMILKFNPHAYGKTQPQGGCNFWRLVINEPLTHFLTLRKT